MYMRTNIHTRVYIQYIQMYIHTYIQCIGMHYVHTYVRMYVCILLSVVPIPLYMAHQIQYTNQMQYNLS